MELSADLLRILVCPATGEKLIYNKRQNEIISETAVLAYPIIDGIPILLIDKARKINNINISQKISSSSSLDKVKDLKTNYVA